MAAFGPSQTTDYDGVVSVRVGPRGPYGLALEDDGSGRCAVVIGWEKVAGKCGPVQRHGGVRVGDALVAVNGASTVDVAFGRVLEMLTDESALTKTLHFSSRADLESRRRSLVLLFPPARQSDETRFVSRVRRARIVQELGKRASSFAEYEVTCAFGLDATRLSAAPAVWRKWAVWRRYSEFERLAAVVSASLGWQFDKVKFPLKHSLTYDKLAPDFLDRRRADLDTWWQALIAVDRAADFHLHHCDPALKAFVKAAAHLTDAQEEQQPESATTTPTAKQPPRGPPVTARSARPQSLQALRKNSAQRLPSLSALTPPPSTTKAPSPASKTPPAATGPPRRASAPEPHDAPATPTTPRRNTTTTHRPPDELQRKSLFTQITALRLD